MTLENSDISCGVDLLYDLGSDPKRMIKEFAEAVVYDLDNPPAFVLFSDAVTLGNGRKLANYIKNNKLGHLQTSRPKVNRNSGNSIQVWVWSVNFLAIEKLTGITFEKAREEEERWARGQYG